MSNDVYKIYHNALYGGYEIYCNGYLVTSCNSQEKAEELIHKMLKEGYDRDGRKLIKTIGDNNA